MVAAFVIEVSLFDGDLFLVMAQASEHADALAEHALTIAADSIILTPKGKPPRAESRLVHCSQVESFERPRPWRNERVWTWEIGPHDDLSAFAKQYVGHIRVEHNEPAPESCAARPPDGLTAMTTVTSIRLDLTLACDLRADHSGWHRAGAREHRLHWTADGKWRIGQ